MSSKEEKALDTILNNKLQSLHEAMAFINQCTRCETEKDHTFTVYATKPKNDGGVEHVVLECPNCKNQVLLVPFRGRLYLFHLGGVVTMDAIH